MTTPLLHLLHGALAQDEDIISEALVGVEQILSQTNAKPTRPVTTECNSSRRHNPVTINLPPASWIIRPPSPPLSSSSQKRADEDEVEQENAHEQTNYLEHIVKQVLFHQPNLASTKSAEDKSLPLHIASTMGDVKIARCLLNVYPAAVLIANKKGKLPIHYAAREGRLEVVNMLLEHNPTCARITSKKNKLPLHFSACDGHRMVSLTLLRAYPEAAALKSQKGRLALHFASRWGHVELVRDLLKVYPEAVNCCDWEGSLPLHDAAREGQVEVARILLAAHPKGIQKINVRGELPLFAAARAASIPLVELLVRAWPKGGKIVLMNMRQEDGIGDWDWNIVELCLRGAVEMLSHPIIDGNSGYNPSLQEWSNLEYRSTNHSHEAMRKWSYSSAIASDQSDNHSRCSSNSGSCTPPGRADIEEQPCKRRCRTLLLNEEGGHEVAVNLSLFRNMKFRALHAALQSHVSLPVLRRVLKMYSMQALEQDHYERTALHLAAAYKNQTVASEKVVQEILKLNVNACFVRDSHGRLPLHSALYSAANVHVIQALLHVNRSSAFGRCRTLDCFADKLPVFMAMSHDCDIAVLYLLIREDPSVLSDCAVIFGQIQGLGNAKSISEER
mmetsp:Transcript_5611/g.8221  ORF Transcript_5611/g.8221 Transcript_5611/m.8221 type:complete len:617 (+) Transcript_5611:436-2286(+)|eukprot:CAMPEP_0196812254 /NCGR_PEP_ID=MMETSP1362-20130617/23752_1 /TAXON_ID=163516 /ORGANISM="Leptocylindrus danicus, Strain CCMP1856" /LENGTH=616 /DNA_ID=CAMNT_0042187809 /DNA_START=414 /DNA_END=2264 /DNA_ORIENTATION=+